MPSRNPSRLLTRWMLPAALLAACCAVMPGCIVWEIRDELRTANYRISSLQTELEELQRTNQRLELVRTQLQILERIQLSLANLDDHLSAVRVIISSMNSMMSLFDFSEDEPAGPDGSGAEDPGAVDAPEAQGQSPDDAGAAPGPKRIRIAPKPTPPAEATPPPPETAPEGG